MLAKISQESPQDRRGLQGFRFQERATCLHVAAGAMTSAGGYENDWFVPQFEAWADRYFTNIHSSLNFHSNRPDVMDETWDDKWCRQMLRTTGNHKKSNQQVSEVVACWGVHQLRFLWAKIAELEQTGTNDQHNVRSRNINKFKNLKSTHPC